MSEMPSPPRLWRLSSPTPPGAARRARLLIVLLMLTALAGVGIGLLYWVSPPHAVAILPIAITTEPGEGGSVPWAEQDRAAFASGNLLGRPLDDPNANPSRDQIRLRFASLSKVPRSQPVVIHLTAPASVDGTGGVYLLPASSSGDSTRNRLTLSELLSALRDCPARHKFLILNLTPPVEDALFAPASGDLSVAIFKTLEAVPDDSRLSLVSCGPGQTPFASAELGRSVFSFYLEVGLKGAADDNSDERVSVKELANFVRVRVNRWSVENRTATQTPTLVGNAPDFVLHANPHTQTQEEKTVSEMAYSDWLKNAWVSLDRWYADGRAHSAPWAFRQARNVLLAAERDLHAGRGVDDVQRELGQRLASAEQLADSLRAIPTPSSLPTLAAMYPGYVLPEPALVEQLRTTVITVESKPPSAPTKPDEKPADALPQEFDAFKTKPHPLLAAASFLVLASDPDVSAGRVKMFAKLLATQSPQIQFAEVLLIRRLAALADQSSLAPWSGERAALALQTAKFLEDASTQLDVISCAKTALDEAYQQRANAEAVLFSPGYASPDDATNRLRKAESTARQVKLAADRLHAAMVTRDDAVLWLTGVTPLINSGTVNAMDATAVANAVAKLNDTLLQPKQHFTAEQFANQVPDWDRLASAVRAALATANQPLTVESLAALRKRAAYADAGPAVYAELDTVLSSPLVPPAERVQLWNARSALARRLCESTLRKDTAEDEAFRNGLPRPPAPELINEEPSDSTLAERRMRWSVTMLEVGGVDTNFVSKTRNEFSQAVRDRFVFADRLRRVWLEGAPALLSRGTATRSLAAILPASSATTSLDQPTTNPLSNWRRETAQQLWAWQTARFEYEARDPADPSVAVTGVPFAVSAARSCAVVGKVSGFPYIEISPVATPKLTFEKPTAELKLNLRVIGAAADSGLPGKQANEPQSLTDVKTCATVEALSPADDWLKPVPCTNATLDSIRENSVQLPLVAGNKPTAYPSSLGVLVEANADFNGEHRTFHRRVPVSLRTLANRVDLRVSTDPKSIPQQLSEFRVRPNGQPLSYQFVLFNPSPLPQKMYARLVGLNRETAVFTIEPNKPFPLVFTSVAPPTAPQPTSPSTKPDDGFRQLSDNALTLELLDPIDKDSVLQTFTLPVAVTDPASYLRVNDAVFTPANEGRRNQLSMTVMPGDIPGSAPCPVQMVFPPQFNPNLVVRDGSQAGNVVNTGKPVKLYAENIAFPSPVGAHVTVTLSADGVERVFTYSASLPTLGQTIRLQPLTDPRVRVNADKSAPGNVPLPVTLEVDNPPTGAKLELLVGTAQNDKSPVNADFTRLISTARDRVVKLRFGPKGDTFELVGSLTDHKPELPVGLLTGKRALEARLLTADGQLVAKDRVYVVFDGNPPANVQFVDLPPRAAKGQPLAVKAICAPTVSGIKDVKFFVGKPNKNELPASPTPMPGVAFDGSEWRATLQMPDMKGLVTVGVKFTTFAGLSTIETQEIELVDAAELNKPKPGAIAGRLIENRIVQANATIFLYDAKGNPLAKATTKADGTFEFKELPPGAYYLFSEKIATNRLVKAQVDVKPGETTTKELELLLK